MGLLDDKFTLGNWPGLLNTPVGPLPPPRRLAPLFVPPIEASHGGPAPRDVGNTGASPLGEAMDGMARDLAARLVATQPRAMAPEPADHGLSERQKLSPLQKALNPITSYPETYMRMNQEARDQVSHGIDQIMHPDSLVDPQAHGISDVLTGAGNVVLGGLGYVGSPISAAYRSLVGQPIEDVTGIPRGYTEFAAQLATPGIGLPKIPGKPAIVPPRPASRAPFGVPPPERVATEALPAELPKAVDSTPEIAPAPTGRTELTPSGRQAPVFEGAMPQLAERYPRTGPPVWKTDAETGKRYPAKQLTSEEQELQAHLDAIQKQLDAGNYEPWFDEAERFPANSANYPPMIDTVNIRAVRTATQAKYEAMARDPEATKRIMAAYHRGRAQEADARGYYDMGQIENEFIKEFGPEEGPRRFKERFADPMGATTAGAKPRANLRMAHFASYIRETGQTMPINAYDVPYPAGGAYVMPNMKLFKRAQMNATGLTPGTPKGYDVSYEILGSDGLPIDRRISRLFHPDMDAPPPGTYGHFKQALIDLARQENVDPRYFRDMVWAGADPHAPMGQTLPPMRPGPSPMEPGPHPTEPGPHPMGHNNPPAEFRLSPTEQNPPPTGHSVVKSQIREVNEIIERTHRITGMPRAEIVRRAELYKKIPLYGLGLMVGHKLLSDGGGIDGNVGVGDRQDGEPQT